MANIKLKSVSYIEKKEKEPLDKFKRPSQNIKFKKKHSSTGWQLEPPRKNYH